ncbi:MAG: N-acetylmuramoyl-L-alanine amidase, partial [Bacteriovoracaceae bacterium]
MLKLFFIPFLFLSLLLKSCFGFVVLIDPGHGGEELGAIRKIRLKQGQKIVNKEVYEKDLALSLAKKVKEKLDPYYTTYLTRSIDRSVGLNERAD